MKTRKMTGKPTVLWAILLVFAVSLCACGKNGKETKAAETEAEGSTAGAGAVVTLENPEESMWNDRESSGADPAASSVAATEGEGTSEAAESTEVTAASAEPTQTGAGESTAAQAETESAEASTEAKSEPATEAKSEPSTEAKTEPTAEQTSETATEPSAPETAESTETDPLALPDGPAAGITYAMYQKMSRSEIAELQKRFDSLKDYSDWLNAVKKLDEESKNYVIIGTDDIDLGQH